MKIAATMIDEVITSAMTEDGRHMALTLRDSAGSLVTLGLPSEKMSRLVDCSAAALSQRKRIVRSNDDARAMFAITWWNLFPDAREGGFVLSLTFGIGGSLDFVLTEHIAACLMDTLSCHLTKDTIHPR
jgi:hypothetical protein